MYLNLNLSSIIFRLSRGSGGITPTNVMFYYNDTGEHLQNILPSINDLNLENFDSEDSAALAADHIYNNIVYVLTTSAYKFVPKRKHNFYKFWWTQELDILKR